MASQTEEQGNQLEDAAAAAAVSSEDAAENNNVEIVKIVPLPHARSEVWTYFGFVANNNGQIMDKTKVVCKICASRFCYSGNTTNFYSHLKSMHGEVNLRQGSQNRKRRRSFDEEEEDELVAELYDSPGPSSAAKRYHSGQGGEERDVLFVDDISQAIVEFLVTDCRPVCVVQGKGFQRLLNLLVPEYKLPERQQLKMMIRKHYDEQRNKPATGVAEILGIE